MTRIEYYRNYLWHVFTAKTRHGTHSPFVYRLLEDVIYPKRLPQEPMDKVERLVIRLESHLGQHHVRWQLPADLAVLPEGAVLVIRYIHGSRERRREWETMRAMEAATVSIDLFCVGLLFFHKGQAKEHFRIRY